MTDTGSQATHNAPAQTTMPLAIRVGAELAGSCIVFFAIYAFSTFGSALFGINMAFIALATGVAYAAVTLIFAKVSGGQFNPAITLASMLIGRTKPLDGVLYIVAQVLGGLIAGAILVGILPTTETLTKKIWLTDVVNGFGDGSVSASMLSSVSASFDITLAVIVEIIASILVVAAAMATSHDDADATAHATAMGLAYGLGAAMAYPVTGAGMNPARSTFARNAGLAQNPMQQLWVFWICPILAAAIVAMVMIGVQLIRDQAAARLTAVQDQETPQDIADEADDQASEGDTSDEHDEQDASADSADDSDHEVDAQSENGKSEPEA